jgi:hypothetical protein
MHSEMNMPETADLQAFIAERVRHWSHKANMARLCALSLKAIQITMAGSLPILALAVPKAASPAVSGTIGACIVIVEGFQQSFRFEQFWMIYRQCANRLANEERMFRFRAGPYEQASRPEALLASRVNDLLSDRLDRWERTIQAALAGQSDKALTRLSADFFLRNYPRQAMGIQPMNPLISHSNLTSVGPLHRAILAEKQRAYLNGGSAVGALG